MEWVRQLVICKYCKAIKCSGECTGLCCAGGKVKLPQLITPPDPLRSLVSGMGNDSKHFLANIQKYNSCFQMTSFGATHIVQDNFLPTFKVLGYNSHDVPGNVATDHSGESGHFARYDTFC